MLWTAARNDLRGLADPSPAHRRALGRLRVARTVSAGVAAALAELDVDIDAVARWSARLRRVPGDAFWAELAAAAAALHRSSDDSWARTFLLSAVLARAGHLPVAGYAFGSWQLPPDGAATTERLAALVELATCYLYRLAPAGTRNLIPPGPLVGSGAYCTVWRHGEHAIKGACNLASAGFLLEQEARTLQLLSGTPARQFLPRFIGWDRRRRLLSREYVPGPTGHELLCSGEFGRRPELAADLRPAHAVFRRELARLNLTLDLHPQNFVRHAQEHRWVLVDVGPVPLIGFDYYDLRSFSGYLRDTWHRRLERMHAEPIRSLDWTAGTEDVPIPAR